jgi:drug/metabolite transporter (DMT)-like permease
MKLGLKGDVIPISSSPMRTIINILNVMMRPWVATGLGLYVISAFAWLALLKGEGVQLSVVFPMISIGYIAVTLLSVLILHEHVRWKFAVAGLVCIAVGVACIGRMPGH